MQKQVVTTSLRLLDEVGLAGLSMRRIATEIGVQPSALYWHFPNKQTILAALADRILVEKLGAPTQHEHSTEQHWQQELLDEALALREALLTYRDGAELVMTVSAFGLSSGIPEARMNHILDRVPGLTSEQQSAVIAAIIHFSYGHSQALQQRENALRFGAEIQGQNNIMAAKKRSAEEFTAAVTIILNGLSAGLSTGLSAGSSAMKG